MSGSATDAAVVNSNGIKMLLANGLSKFFIKDKPIFSNGPRSLPRNPPDYIISDSWVFHNFISDDELFAKALWSLETCLSVINNIYRKLVSSLESLITFPERFQVTSFPFFIPHCNLFRLELDNFTFKMLNWVILY